jgi:hypothetical protein
MAMTGANLLTRSSGLHLDGVHESREAWIFSRPVVHWHFMSVKAQPEPEAATAKQGICSNRVSMFVLLESCCLKCPASHVDVVMVLIHASS